MDYTAACPQACGLSAWRLFASLRFGALAQAPAPFAQIRRGRLIHSVTVPPLYKTNNLYAVACAPCVLRPQGFSDWHGLALRDASTGPCHQSCIWCCRYGGNAAHYTPGNRLSTIKKVACATLLITTKCWSIATVFTMLQRYVVTHIRSFCYSNEVAENVAGSYISRVKHEVIVR